MSVSGNATIGQQLRMVDDGAITNTVIKAYNPTPDSPTAYGCELLVGGNGNIFIGAGESHTSLRTAMSSSDTILSGETYSTAGERLYLSADASVHLYANCNTIASRKALTFDGSLYPSITNQSSNLGTSSNPWKNIYLQNDSWILSKTYSELSTTDSNTTVAAGTPLNIFGYNSNHNLHIGAGISDNNIITGGTYITGANKVQLQTCSGSINLNPSKTNVMTVASSTTTISNTLHLSKTTDASGTADNSPALIIGSKTGTHLEFDGNEILAKSSGTATNALYLNNDGGAVGFGGNAQIKGTVRVGSSGASGGAVLSYDSTNKALVISVS